VPGERDIVEARVVEGGKKMRKIGIRELKAHLSETVRDVQEQGEIVDITCRGEIVARIVPVPNEGASHSSTRAAIMDLNSLRAEIGRLWTPGLSVQEVIDDIRR
jgi:prevent-host-death family protein